MLTGCQGGGNKGGASAHCICVHMLCSAFCCTHSFAPGSGLSYFLPDGREGILTPGSELIIEHPSSFLPATGKEMTKAPCTSLQFPCPSSQCGKPGRSCESVKLPLIPVPPLSTLQTNAELGKYECTPNFHAPVWKCVQFSVYPDPTTSQHVK